MKGNRSMRKLLFVASALLALTGCSKDAPDAGAGGHGHEHGPEGGHGGGREEPAAESAHGGRKELGQLTVGGHAFKLVLLGEVKGGAESGLEAHLADEQKAEFSNLNVYAWVEDAAGKQLSPPDKAKVEGGALHFHLNPRSGAEPQRVVLRVRTEGVD
jgi:hypothetical protein